MNAFIQLNLEDKEIEIPINKEIEKILNTKLGHTYSFDENGKIQYNGNKENQMLFYETILDILKSALIHGENIPTEIKEKISKDDFLKGNLDQSSIAKKFFIKQRIIELAENYYEYIQLKRSQDLEKQGKIKPSEEKMEKPILEETKESSAEEKTENPDDLSEKTRASGQNATENLELAKQIFLRASKDKLLGKYITQEMMDELFNNVKICKDNKEFFEEYFMKCLKETPYKIIAFEDVAKDTIKYFIGEKETEEEGDTEFCDNEEEFIKKIGNKESQYFLTAAYFDGEGKVVVPQNATLDTIVHELVHKSSKIGHEKLGIYEPADKLIKDGRGPWREFGAFSSGLNKKMVTSLDESFTEMITRLLLPEIGTSSGYDYGSDLITKYYATCKEDSQRDRFLKAYYKKNEISLDLLAMDIERAVPMQENLWFNFCKAIVSGECFYTKGSTGAMKNMLSKEKIKQIFENLSRKNASEILKSKETGETR